MRGHAMLDNWLESLDARRIGGMRRSHDAASERVTAIRCADGSRVETLEQSDGNGSGNIDVALHLRDDGVGGDRRLADVPAIVVGDETDGRVANLSLASQLGLRQTRHADNRRVNEAVEIGLGARGKRGTLHADIGAAIECLHTGLGAKLVCNAVNIFTQLCANRIAKRHVRHEAGLVEKRVILFQAIEILINDNDVTTIENAIRQNSFFFFFFFVRTHGFRSSFRLPTAVIATIRSTPSDFNANIFARCGTSDGGMAWPLPCRAMKNTSCVP